MPRNPDSIRDKPPVDETGALSLGTPRRCKATIKFADDYGDNEATFRCQFAAGHDGPHQEQGHVGRDWYLLRWGKETRDAAQS